MHKNDLTPIGTFAPGSSNVGQNVHHGLTSLVGFWPGTPPLTAHTPDRWKQGYKTAQPDMEQTFLQDILNKSE